MGQISVGSRHNNLGVFCSGDRDCPATSRPGVLPDRKLGLIPHALLDFSSTPTLPVEGGVS